MTAGRHRACLLGCLVLAFLVVPAAASAHLRQARSRSTIGRASSFRTRTAFTAQIYQSDRALHMSIRSGHTVTVLGYLGEPVFRLDRFGLWVNVASPTSVVIGLVTKRGRVLVTSPRWRLQRGRRSVIWRDGRAQALPSGVTAGSWSVPLLVDGRRGELNGTLRRLPSWRYGRGWRPSGSRSRASCCC